MGYALAQAAIDAGARTTLVSGPVQIEAPAQARLVQVESARDMLHNCLELLPECDIFISCAAVADYRPASIAQQKIKKGPDEITLQLVRNPDIVATIAASSARPFTVGFAAETTDVLAYARDKLTRKGLNMIIANDVSDPAIGFNSDMNEATALWPGGEQALERTGKGNMARQIIRLITEQLSTDSS